MGTLNTLISRHSVRTYTGDAVSASDLEKLLKAANAALVGMGLYDQVHLTVVNNQDFIANADTRRQPLCRQKERILHTMFLHLFLFRQRNKIQCLKV